MAPVTRYSARDRTPGTPQQRDNILTNGIAKPAGIRKRLKPDKPDKQKAALVENHGFRGRAGASSKSTVEHRTSSTVGDGATCVAFLSVAKSV
ncbi:uncharacterized protein ASPGLDRAFT_44483 [Aspergillus glaucus CBS 516.65]|uniref:Uncharacterized protein n=1 Tax=Aspergillus glaucus CBS 516.65 TaxID=1160497 RepID=A0A1L9VRW2_ASPGL|nr:hypothetical protein ASPGLDRAFT_44483 [Aspergillus glaucus CBS 516.65]OJJ86639.1 hypothetical protein ASPGLDRAFT_44483 [Aspergillus glaucus CBS 516.65]